MRRLLDLAVLGVSIALPLHGAELANLRNGFSIRHERHETVSDTTRLYMHGAPDSGYIDVPTAEIESFESAPPDPTEAATPSQKPLDLSSLVNQASARNQVDADFIASVIRAESGNNPRAVSRKGAQGLMQLMPQTATNLGVRNTFDPSENVDGGVRYLRDLLLLYNNDMIKALAAYNAGPQRVQQYKGLPPYYETHAYVARVIKDYNRKKVAKRQSRTSLAAGHASSNKAVMAQKPPASTSSNE
jgi:soluble lytic murein transglycosylase-like protein